MEVTLRKLKRPEISLRLFLYDKNTFYFIFDILTTMLSMFFFFYEHGIGFLRMHFQISAKKSFIVFSGNVGFLLSEKEWCGSAPDCSCS